MHQIIQNIRNGELLWEEVPPPALQPGGVRVRTAASLISAGTEKMLIDLGKKSLAGKAQARPDLVRQVLSRAKTDGVLNTYKKVLSRLNKPVPMGYSAAGIVESVGAGVTDLQVGDRVAVGGAGYANHAEINFVPRNLVASVPDNVSMEEACYTTVAAIALQGIRIGQPQLGETVVVYGLGLIGLLTLQMLKANGCRVIGVDVSPAAIDLAKTLGLDHGINATADNVESAVEMTTGGRFADMTIITASTKDDGPIAKAGEITRRRGRVVIVGSVGMAVPRPPYYAKELEILFSMSYGPGRYDPTYEEMGIDYPFDYVRWTEGRNMSAVLELMSSGGLNVNELTTHAFSFDKAMDAYAMIQAGDEPYTGVIMTYDLEREQPEQLHLRSPHGASPKDVLSIGFIGAGNYASTFLLPHLKENPSSRLKQLVTATGTSAKKNGQSFGFEQVGTDAKSVFGDADVDTVFIATRHATHAGMTLSALQSGKHVFVEKPLCVTDEQLDQIVAAYAEANEKSRVGLMVGVNRRFSPMIAEMKSQFSESAPVQMLYRINSGPIPTTTWLHEEAEGGGMLVGEMCHFVDVMTFVSGSSPVSVDARFNKIGSASVGPEDNVVMTITYENGSVGVLAYNTIGDKSAPKEYLEVLGQGCVCRMDDFRTLKITKGGSTSTRKASNQDKGQANQIAQTVDAFKQRGEGPIPFVELIETARLIFGARESGRAGVSYIRPNQPLARWTARSAD